MELPTAKLRVKVVQALIGLLALAAVDALLAAWGASSGRLVVQAVADDSAPLLACNTLSDCQTCVTANCAWCSWTNSSSGAGECILLNGTCTAEVTIHKYIQTCYVSSRALVIGVAVTLSVLVITIPLCIVLWKRREKLKRIEWRFGERRAFSKMMDKLQAKYGNRQRLLDDDAPDANAQSKAANANLSSVLKTKKTGAV